MDNTLWNRQMKDVTLDVVDLLVRQIYAGIRGYVVQSVELKFNCFFLMPLMNEFAGFLRQEMETQFEDSLDSVFDVRSVRGALEERQRKLESELEQMERIQEKFASIHNQLELRAQGSPATAAAANEARAANGGFKPPPSARSTPPPWRCAPRRRWPRRSSARTRSSRTTRRRRASRTPRSARPPGSARRSASATFNF